MNSLDAYITCPFNKSHRVIEARLQYHLAKCRKNYPADMKVVCVFDATHMLNADEIEHHLSICPSSGIIKCYENSFEPEQEVGTIPLEQACNLDIDAAGENWTGNHTSYDPLIESENKTILRMQAGLSRAKRKQFKLNERDRILILEKENNSSNNVSDTERTIDFDQPLRAPKNISKAVSYITNDTSDNVVPELNNVSISETSNSLERKNITILNNASPKRDNSQSSSLRNRSINTSNVSLTSKSAFEQEEKNDICAKENIPFAINYSTPPVAANDSKVKNELKLNVCQENSPKMPKHSKETKSQEGSELPNLTKGYSIKSRSPLHLSAQMTEKLYGAVKKISTGRGFTMAHQLLNSSLSRMEGNQDLQKLSALFSDDDDD